MRIDLFGTIHMNLIHLLYSASKSSSKLFRHYFLKLRGESKFLRFDRILPLSISRRKRICTSLNQMVPFCMFIKIFLFPTNFFINFAMCSTPKFHLITIYIQTIQWVLSDLYSSRFTTHTPSVTAFGKLFCE